MTLPGRTATAVGVAVLALVAGCAGSASPPPASATWERIDPDPGGEGGPLEIVAWGGGFVGVGGADAWTSTDGRAWRAVPLPGAGGGAKAIAVTAGRLVAVGSTVDPSVEWGTRAAAWTSDDGESWEPAASAADLEPAPGFRSTEMSQVVEGRSGLVAVGVEWGDGGQHPQAWRSADGRDWVRASNAPTGSGAGDVLATRDGYVMAVADTARTGEMIRAAFWWSEDGLAWKPAPSIPSFANAEPQRLATDGNTIVAVGYRMTTAGLAPMAWTSVDGSAWDPAPDAPAMSWWPVPGPTPVQGQGAIQGTAMWDVHGGPDGFTAVGSSWGLDGSRPGPDGSHPLMIRGVAWRSGDGRAWELLPGDFVAVSEAGLSTVPYGLLGVTELDERLVIAGTTPDLGATLWVESATAE